ncbi:sulfotransferase 1 family member D1 [Ixodes scapularis]
MNLAPKRTPYLQVIEGVPRSPLLKPEICLEAVRFKPSANDVILVTHPKSGTHWVAQILLLVLNGGRPPRDLADQIKQAPFIEMNGVPNFDQSPRLLRTHLPFGQLPYNRDAKYIYVARNPYDTCVSSYYHVKLNAYYRFADGSFEDFVDAFLEGKVGFGHHLDHVLSGYARRHEPNVFFVTYEKLKADTAGTVLELAKFLGEPYSSEFDKDEGLLDEVLFKSSVDYMKKTYKANYEEARIIYNLPSPSPEVEAEAKILGSKAGFAPVRKGLIGNWRAHFSAEELERMQAWIDAKTQGSDVMNLWMYELAGTRLTQTP